MLCRALALGQALALCIAVTAASSTALAERTLSFPTLQSFLNYLLLAVVYGVAHLGSLRSGDEPGGGGGAQRRLISRPWWQYALLAALDVEANFLVVTAYRYTSMTSVTLLDCWAVPVALLLTRLVLSSAYRTGHYGGAALCIAGLAVLVVSDQRDGGGGGDAPSSLAGDALVVLGATLYAVSNVLQEHLLGEVPPIELLCMLGAFGSLWSGVQGLPLELPALLAARWTPATAAPFLAFGLAMFAFYSGVPYELRWGGAALLNLSLLSADIWTALARLLFFGGFSAAAAAGFLAAFAVVAAGIALYSVSGDVKQVLVPPPRYMLVDDASERLRLEAGGGRLEAGGKRGADPPAREESEAGREPRFGTELTPARHAATGAQLAPPLQ